MTQRKEIETLKEKARAIEDRFRSFEERIREIEQGFSTSAVVAFVDHDRCAGCGICQDVCLAGAIAVEKIAQVDPKHCTGCGSCIQQCPSGALSLHPIRQGELSKTLRNMVPGKAWI